MEDFLLFLNIYNFSVSVTYIYIHHIFSRMTDQEPPPVQPKYARFDSRSGGYENTDGLRQRNGSTGATSASVGVKSSLSSSSTSNNKMDELRPIIISTLIIFC